MKRKAQGGVVHGPRRRRPDADETKAHVLAAGRELLLAARGALAFCRDYAKGSASQPSRSQLMIFFAKAMDVADELSRGLASATRVPGAAKTVAGQFFDAVGREMKEQQEQEKREKAAKRRRPCPRGTRRS
ncbi:MAG: hypothetical protein JXA24_02520 [Proteobacteria bacterium]|nr:hypothetical protein [Pseudomonadota bacterium]